MFTLSRTVAASLAGLLCFSAIAARAETILGEARIVDGDTVDIGEKKIRLHGIDAPETDQLCLDARGEKWACGIAARDALSAFSKDRPWSCDVSGKDRYDRFLASCSIAGENINQWMVRHGWALAFVKYSDRYLDDETKARDTKAGLWSGAFIAPWGPPVGSSKYSQPAGSVHSSTVVKSSSISSAAKKPTISCSWIVRTRYAGMGDILREGSSFPDYLPENNQFPKPAGRIVRVLVTLRTDASLTSFGPPIFTEDGCDPQKNL